MYMIVDLVPGRGREEERVVERDVVVEDGFLFEIGGVHLACVCVCAWCLVL